MCLTVVVTGNHYVLDIVAGFAVFGAALGLSRLLPRDLPGLRGWLAGRHQRQAAHLPSTERANGGNTLPPTVPP
jgi:hypothetical protein